MISQFIMRKTVFSKNYIFILLIIIFFLFFFSLQKIIFNKNFDQSKLDFRISIIKIIASTGFFDITKFTSENSPSFFNKNLKDLFLTSPFLTSNKKVKPEKIFLNINSKNYSVINNNIIESRLLDRISDRRRFANANFIHKNKKYYTTIRLKGDYPIHWNHDERFSLKFNLKKNDKFKEIEEFSLQNFNTISFPDDFIFSKTLNYYGIFTPKLDIVDLYVNGDHWGPMIFKEYYNEDFFENRSQRNFILFKYLDDTKTDYLNHLIKYHHKNIDPNILKHVNKTFSSSFSIYDENNILNKEIISLFKTFRELSDIQDEKEHSALLKFIDLDQIIKISSFNLLFGESHSTYVGNLRVYYNDYTERFYIIPTESYPIEKLTEEKYHSINKGLFLKFDSNQKIDFLSSMLEFILDFEKNYESNFKKVFSKDVCIYSLDSCDLKIDNIYKVINQNIKLTEKFIKNHIKNLKLENNKNYSVNKKSKKINKIINENKNLIKNKYIKNYNFVMDHFSVRIFNEIIDINYFFDPELELESIENITRNKIFKINKKINKGINKIYFSFLNNFKINDEIIIKYKFNSKKFKKKIIVENYDYNKNNFRRLKSIKINQKFIQENNNHFLIKSGKWVVDTPINIFNKDLIIEPGTEIEFSKNSYIRIENGNFISIGKTSSPILLKDSPQNYWGGLKIINSDKSIIKNTHFINVSNFDNGLSKLTGAINFYNSNVIIEDSFFENSKAEDFINFISSKFKFSNSIITNTISDAIDSDFSQGEILNSKITNIKGDGIDTSFSKVVTSKNHLENISDKAFSIGERSYLKINDSIINNAKIGIVIKDSSSLKGKNNSIKNSKFADVATYNKKKKFSKSFTELGIIEKDIKYFSTLDNTLILNGIKTSNVVDNDKLNKQIYGL